MMRSFPDPEAAPLVAVLAAGQAARFGGGKLDARCAGKRLGRWALDAVADAGLAPGVIVMGIEPPLFAVEAERWSLVSNTEPESGLASSLRLAAGEARAQGASSLLVLLADMPLVPPDLLAALARSDHPAAACHADGRPGTPALIPRKLFSALTGLEGDRGAAAILAAERDLRLLEAAPVWLLDVDTAKDLARAEALLLGL